MKMLLVFVASLACSGCSWMTGYNDISSASYKDYKEAAEQRAFESGWLPAELPRSATRILEVHSIDSSEIWLRFSFSPEDVLGFIRLCNKVQVPSFPDENRTRNNVSWWLPGLVKGARPDKQVDVYSCPEMKHAGLRFPAGLAIENSSSTAWYWVVKP